jgi:hypothetical protein
MTAPTWRKSTRCAANGTCVETARWLGTVYIRDAARPYGPEIDLTLDAWRDLLRALKEAR